MSDDDQALDNVLDEIAEERASQDAKWGEQNHPSVPNNLIGRNTVSIGTEALARHMCEMANRDRHLTWAHIAVEELAEAIDAPDDHKRREELVQMAAVVVAWIQCIDRREAAAADVKLQEEIRHNDAFSELISIADGLNVDELSVLSMVAKRLQIGKNDYGDLDIANDGRDWKKQAVEEALDQSIYCSIDLLKACGQ